jgi:hypothetical protein
VSGGHHPGQGRREGLGRGFRRHEPTHHLAWDERRQGIGVHSVGDGIPGLADDDQVRRG